MDSDFQDLELSHLPQLHRAIRKLASVSPRLSRDYLMDPRIPRAPRLPKTLLADAEAFSDATDPLPDFRMAAARSSRAANAKRSVAANGRSWPNMASYGAFAVMTAVSLGISFATLLK